LDEFLADNQSTTIDYIHGQDVFEDLAKKYDNLGLYFSPVTKEKFFDTVIECGVLPKKCFSMGEAEQKRYYTECRLLVRPHEEKPEEHEPEEEKLEILEPVAELSSEIPEEKAEE
ncbi:MAG: hypothetical protein WCP73_09130, partial [Eubacteriales bacterium]